jgi:hypothetical protein
MAGISPAAEASRTSDRPLSCGRGSSLLTGSTLPAQRAAALMATPRQDERSLLAGTGGLAAGPQVAPVAGEAAARLAVGNVAAFQTVVLARAWVGANPQTRYPRNPGLLSVGSKMPVR